MGASECRPWPSCQNIPWIPLLSTPPQCQHTLTPVVLLPYCIVRPSWDLESSAAQLWIRVTSSGAFGICLCCRVHQPSVFGWLTIMLVYTHVQMELLILQLMNISFACSKKDLHKIRIELDGDLYFYFSEINIWVWNYWVIHSVWLPLKETAKALNFLPAIQESSHHPYSCQYLVSWIFLI